MDKRRYRLPRAVYYQCIWIVKDIERLKRLARAADTGCREDELVFFEVDEDAVNDREVLRQARHRLECIRKALRKVPKEFRRGTLDSIVYNVPFKDMAHENTWRRWRGVFIRELAANLKLI